MHMHIMTAKIGEATVFNRQCATYLNRRCISVSLDISRHIKILRKLEIKFIIMRMLSISCNNKLLSV